MRRPRADLEEKQEPRAATSGSAERRAEGMWHDVTRKSLTEAAIEKPTFSPERRLGSCGGSASIPDKVAAVLSENVNAMRTFDVVPVIRLQSNQHRIELPIVIKRLFSQRNSSVS